MSSNCGFKTPESPLDSKEKTPESSLDSKKIKPVNLKGNQLWIFIGRNDAEAETPVFWSSDANRDSLEKSLMLGKIDSRRRRGHQWVRWLDGITDAMNMNLGKLQEMVRNREAWHVAVHGVSKSLTWLGDWTITIVNNYLGALSSAAWILNLTPPFLPVWLWANYLTSLNFRLTIPT